MKTLKYIALSLLVAASTTACKDDPELLTTDVGPEMTVVSADASGVYGGKVRGLNSFENLCVGQAQAFFAGVDYLRFADLFGCITKEEAEDLIARWVTPERTALSVIRPKETE